jgi:ferric-dicitrate binding protein FerR (iron transport regulator)
MVMQLQTEHELHRRRRSRNIGLGLVLVGFVALVFALTVVKVQQGDLMEGYDHQPRVSVTPAVPEAASK